MKYTTEIEVRFSDIDAYGHVNNAVYFTYLETARVKFFKEHLEHLMLEGVLFLIVKAECEYKKPIGLSDTVLITIGVENIGNSSFTLTYKVHDQNSQIFALGKTVVVSFDAKNQKPIKIPEKFLELLSTLY